MGSHTHTCTHTQTHTKLFFLTSENPLSRKTVMSLVAGCKKLSLRFCLALPLSLAALTHFSLVQLHTLPPLIHPSIHPSIHPYVIQCTSPSFPLITLLHPFSPPSCFHPDIHQCCQNNWNANATSDLLDETESQNLIYINSQDFHQACSASCHFI